MPYFGRSVACATREEAVNWLAGLYKAQVSILSLSGLYGTVHKNVSSVHVDWIALCEAVPPVSSAKCNITFRYITHSPFWGL